MLSLYDIIQLPSKTKERHKTFTNILIRFQLSQSALKRCWTEWIKFQQIKSYVAVQMSLQEKVLARP